MTYEVSAERRWLTGKYFYYHLSVQIRTGDTRRVEGGVGRKKRKFQIPNPLWSYGFLVCDSWFRLSELGGEWVGHFLSQAGHCPPPQTARCSSACPWKWWFLKMDKVLKMESRNKQKKIGNSINFIECENFKHLEQYIVCSQMLAAISIIIIITIFLACFLAQT